MPMPYLLQLYMDALHVEAQHVQVPVHIPVHVLDPGAHIPVHVLLVQLCQVL